MIRDCQPLRCPYIWVVGLNAILPSYLPGIIRRRAHTSDLMSYKKVGFPSPPPLGLFSHTPGVGRPSLVTSVLRRRIALFTLYDTGGFVRKKNSIRMPILLRIDTGDAAWYVMVAIKRLLLNSCSRYIAILKRIWTSI